MVEGSGDLCCTWKTRGFANGFIEQVKERKDLRVIPGFCSDQPGGYWRHKLKCKDNICDTQSIGNGSY